MNNNLTLEKISSSIGQSVGYFYKLKNYETEDSLRSLIAYAVSKNSIDKEFFFRGFKAVCEDDVEVAWKSFIENIVPIEDVFSKGTLVKLKDTNDILGYVMGNDMEVSLSDRSNLNYYISESISEETLLSDCEMYLHHDLEIVK